jgi:hypothetical protein
MSLPSLYLKRSRLGNRGRNPIMSHLHCRESGVGPEEIYFPQEIAPLCPAKIGRTFDFAPLFFKLSYPAPDGPPLGLEGDGPVDQWFSRRFSLVSALDRSGTAGETSHFSQCNRV